MEANASARDGARGGRADARRPTARRDTRDTHGERSTRHRDRRLRSAVAPWRNAHRLSRRVRTPRPTRSRVTHCRWQISWLAGRRFRPPSQEYARVPSGKNGQKLAAYSCGGSRGIGRMNTRTAFPFDPLREPPSSGLHAGVVASIDGGRRDARKGRTVASAPHSRRWPPARAAPRRAERMCLKDDRALMLQMAQEWLELARQAAEEE
jgi:hypothetical protein